MPTDNDTSTSSEHTDPGRDPSHRDAWFRFVLRAMWTGLRRSEVLALRPQDIGILTATPALRPRG